MHDWKVVPLSRGQRLDVRPEDIVENGLYRKCNTYKGGGGYDQFPVIARRRFGSGYEYNDQFIVQLYGCNLDCPYCYVTREGVWSQPVRRTTDELVDAFRRSGQTVFHLMGGAPALQMKHWPELLSTLRARSPGALFHSDMMLSEGLYDPRVLKDLARFNDRALYAINVKGTTSDQWLRNTRKPANWNMFWHNWRRVQDSGVKAYITFTGCRPDEIERFWNRVRCGHGIDVDGIYHASGWLGDSFAIDLIEYDAQPHVDDVPWGAVDER